MLLLNRGMMQVFKHPLHRNDLSGLVSNFTYLIGGDDYLSEAEIANLRTITSSVPFNIATVTNAVRAGRIDMGFVTMTVKKAHGSQADSSVFRWAEVPQILTVSTSGKLLYIWSVYFNTSGANGRVGYLFSVGLPGSGADIEIEKVDFVVGERIKLNDIVINIENLLGEA